MRGSISALLTYLLILTSSTVLAPAGARATPGILEAREIVIGFKPSSRTSSAMKSFSTGVGMAALSNGQVGAVSTALSGFERVKPVFAGRSSSSALSSHASAAREPTFLDSTYVLAFREGMHEDEKRKAIVELMKLPGIAFVEPNLRYQALWVPNDHFYGRSGSWGQPYADQWNLKRMDIERAWDVSRGEGVVVAVIDTGVDYNHPDLAQNMWRNTREIPGNGVDDDGNGYVDDTIGWDFTTCAASGLFGGCSQTKQPDNDPRDGHGHGTHVSGTVAAVTDNRIGIAGVAPKAKIMALKGLGDDGGGALDELAAAVVYAVDNGADIINASWGGEGASSLMEQVFEYARQKGVVALVAAGNSNASIETFSPAGLPSVLTVGSTDESDKKSDFSNFSPLPTYGTRAPVKVDISAPGGGSGSMDADFSGQHVSTNILSLRASGSDMYLGAPNYSAGKFALSDGTSGSAYYRSRGTSMACPAAAGVAALVLSRLIADSPGLNRKDVTVRSRLAADVKARLTLTTDPLAQAPVGADGRPIYLGTGRVNAYRALTATPSAYLEVRGDRIEERTGNGNGIPETNEIVDVYVTLENRWADSSSVDATLTSLDGSRAQVIGGNASYGPIRQGEIKDNSGSAFRVRVVQASGLTPARFRLDTSARTAQGNVAQSIEITIHFGAKKLSANVPATAESFLGEYASPDGPAVSGRRVVWTDNRNGSSDIYVYDFANKTERAVTTHAGEETHPAISGDVVVWQDDRGGDWDIYYGSVTAPGEARVPVPAAVAKNLQIEPDIDGTRIVWTDQASGGGLFNDLNIYSYDIASGELAQLTTSSAPQFNPAAGGGAVVWEDIGALGVIYTTNPTNPASRTNISPSLTWAIEPDVDGQRAAFIGATLSGKLLYTSTLIPGNAPQSGTATDLPGLPSRPRISGNSLVWEHSQNGKKDVYFKDLVTGEQIKVTNSSGSSRYPDVSGKLVAWISDGVLWATEIGASYTPPPSAQATLSIKGRVPGKKGKWAAGRIAGTKPQVQLAVTASGPAEINVLMSVNGEQCASPVAALRSKGGAHTITGTLPKAKWLKNVSFRLAESSGDILARGSAKITKAKAARGSAAQNTEAVCSAFARTAKVKSVKKPARKRGR